jgi:hypothetical protein
MRRAHARAATVVTVSSLHLSAFTDVTADLAQDYPRLNVRASLTLIAFIPAVSRREPTCVGIRCSVLLSYRGTSIPHETGARRRAPVRSLRHDPLRLTRRARQV